MSSLAGLFPDRSSGSVVNLERSKPLKSNGIPLIVLRRSYTDGIHTVALVLAIVLAPPCAKLFAAKSRGHNWQERQEPSPINIEPVVRSLIIKARGRSDTLDLRVGATVCVYRQQEQPMTRPTHRVCVPDEFYTNVTSSSQRTIEPASVNYLMGRARVSSADDRRCTEVHRLRVRHGATVRYIRYNFAGNTVCTVNYQCGII